MVGKQSSRRRWGSLEDEVLAVLWAADAPVTAAAVLEALGGGLAYTTVTTVLTRLRGKGLVNKEGSARPWRYTPVRDAAGHAAHEMYALLTAGPDRAQVLARFLSELSADDERLLRELIDDAGEP